MDVNAVLKTVLERECAIVWPRVAPSSAEVPYVVYKLINSTERITFAGRSGLYRDRYQIICITADDASCRTLTEDIEDQLIVNQTDFEMVFPLFNKVEYMEGNMYASRQDFYVIYRK
jgi:hypothetical protein